MRETIGTTASGRAINLGVASRIDLRHRGEAIELPPATAKNAVTTLEDQGFVHRHDTKWRIVDPLLGDWLRRRFR